MPEQQPSSVPNFNRLELSILKFWEENKIFEKSLEQTKDKEPFIFYDGPPFATGTPHHGSILSSVIKDAVGRYQTMKGRFVRRRWGWDCHGLPIENIVEQNLKISGKKQIEEIGVERFNKVCRENVLKFVEEWGKVVKRIGRWVDFDNSYKTMDTSYMESVWWALKQIWDKGLIYQDRKVLLYCSRCETPVSNFEVAMDNSYRDITEESIYVKFKLLPRQRIANDLTDNKTFALAWTTTPWTLPGNTSLNVGPNIAYVLIEQNGERYILAKDRLSIIEGEYELVSEFSAGALEGLEYEPVFPGVIPSAHSIPEQGSSLSGVQGDPGQAHRFYLADFVTVEDGTGIVHNAAMYGEEDYELAKAKHLPLVDMLDNKGRYFERAPLGLRGMFFKDADKVIIEDLKKAGLVYKTENITHSYPYCWRCGTPLYYLALPAWFINIQKIKSDLLKLNESINWHPEHLKYGRFANSVEQAPDWNISRNRYWATALPFWVCSAAGCGHKVCVGSVKELRDRSLNFSEVYPAAEFRIKNYELGSEKHNSEFIINDSDLDLHKPYIDQVKLKCEKCGGEMRRVPEVVDCWVESGSMPFAELHYPFEHNLDTAPSRDLEAFQNRFPADFVAEYIAQTRAWFYVMHVINTILFNQAPFKHVVTTGTILAEDGSKMSKSKGNYPEPQYIFEHYGVDALRFYLLSSPVMNAQDVNFSEKGVMEINRKVSLLLYNVWSFYSAYRRTLNYTAEGNAGNGLSQTNPLANTPEHETDSRGSQWVAQHVLDRWITARLAQAQNEITKHMDNYNTVRAGKEIVSFIDDLSTWYLRRSRERIKSDEKSSDAALQTLGYVLAETAKLIAPFMPFLADFIYRDVTGKESVHLENWTTPTEYDTLILQQMEVVRKIAELGLALRKEKHLKVRQPLSELVYEGVELPEEIHNILAEELNVKKVSNLQLPVSNAAVWAVKADQNLKVAVNLIITDDLRKEGYARELERQLQDLRKKSGLKVGQLADLYYNTQDSELEQVLLSQVDRKKTFINQIAKSLEVEVDFETQGEVEGKGVWLGLVKI